MRLSRILSVVAGVLLPLSSAFAFDHTKLNGLLTATVSSGKVDYAALRTKAPDLDAYLQTVATASATQPMGFYINAYNALVLDALLDSGAALPAKVTDIAGFFDKKYYKVAGKDMTLNELETMLRSTYKDPRIHFALNCGAKSCPPLRSTIWPEDTTALSKALDDATIAFFNGGGAKIDDTKREIQVTKLMDWYGKDFTDHSGTVQAYVAKYVKDATKVAQLQTATTAGYAVTFQTYNWAPNSK